ncbi:hypothetical protein DFH28DRAFT_850684, partial [Melampsora americana]
FTDIILGTYHDNIRHIHCCHSPNEPTEPNLLAILTCPPSDKARKMPILQYLANKLVSDFDLLYDLEDDDGEFLIDRRLVFNLEDHAWPIAKNADIILGHGVSLRAILGSEAIEGMFKTILQCLSDWKESELYRFHINDINQLGRLRVTAAYKKLEKEVVKHSQNSKRKAQVANLDIPDSTQRAN